MFASSSAYASGLVGIPHHIILKADVSDTTVVHAPSRLPRKKLSYDEPGELESLSGGTMPINELEERAKTLRLELAQQQDENEKLKEENQRLNEEVEKGKRENGELRDRNGDLEQRNRDLEERWNEVQERLGPYNR